MTTLIDDSFARADENPLASPYATPSTMGSLQLVSNAVGNVTGSTDSGMYDNGSTYPDNQWAEVTIGTVGGGDCGPSVRQSSGGNHYCTTNYNGADIILFKVTGGTSYNQIGSVTSVYAPGDVIYLEAQGDATSTTLVVKKNGSTVLTYTDTTTPFTGGKAGMFGYDGTYRFSRFRGGDFAAGGTTVTPGAGSLVLSGQTPLSITPIIISPAAGALRLVGLEPQIPEHIVTVGDVGVLSYVGGDGLVGGLELPQNTQPQPSIGVLTLTGQAPTVTTTSGSNVTVTPSAGALVLAGQVPTVLASLSASPGAGALALAGQAPSVLQSLFAQPGVGALVLAGQAPVLLQDNIRAPTAGALTISGLVPAVLNGDAKVVQPDAGSLTLVGQAPTVLAAISVAPGAGALVLAGEAPTVTATQTAQPGVGALVLAGQVPTLSVTANVTANPLTGALVFTGLAPTASTSDNRIAAPGAGALTLTGEPPVVPIPSPTVTPDPGALFLEGLAPGIVVSGDTLLSAKYLARRPNVRVKGLQPEPQPAASPLAPEITNMPGTEEVVRKAQGLNLGLITAPPAAPVPPAAAPAVEVPPIGATVLAGPPPAAPEPTPATPAPEPAAPPAPATRDDVAALHKAILEATKVEVGAQADRVLLVLASVLEKVDDLQAKIEADAKARDLRERNIQRAKQITERMLRDLEK